jgi:SanA protein
MASHKKSYRWLLAMAAFLFLVTSGINLYVIFSTKKFVFNQVANLPQRECALVLGTEPFRPDGTTNLHFINRTDLAAKIYSSGKVAHLLISGNRNNRGFNEPLQMEKRVLAENVPATAIELDFGGARTWDSIRRAKEIYHVQKIFIVTDSFHAPRAIFLCRHFGIDAIAICPAKDPFSLWSVRYNVKEYFARLLAVFDVLVRGNHEPAQ